MVISEPESEGKAKSKKVNGGGSSSSEIDEILKTQHLMRTCDSENFLDLKLIKLHFLS